jgi:uncharacterized protein YndB with AHSA1/START domain
METRAEIFVRRAPEAAFRAFVHELSSWWPAEYTWSQDALVRIAIEPKLHGACFEIGPHGFRCDWGRITAFREPVALCFLWQISARREPVPDPRKASEVDVRFRQDPDGTRVGLVHGGFENHGDDGGWYRDAMASEMGWPKILEAYRRYADG